MVNKNMQLEKNLCFVFSTTNSMYALVIHQELNPSATVRTLQTIGLQNASRQTQLRTYDMLFFESKGLQQLRDIARQLSGSTFQLIEGA